MSLLTVLCTMTISTQEPHTHGSQGPNKLESIHGFSAALRDVNKWHIPMLNDVDRNYAYYQALKAVIVPGESIVLDIGTGTSGILAMISARLGALKVFTVEENQAVAVVASETFARNGLSNDISLSICSSFMLKLKRSSSSSSNDSNQSISDNNRGECYISSLATILVSEVLSTSLTGEGVIRTIEDAKSRLCVEAVVVIPQAAWLYVSVVQSNELFQSSYVNEWGGFDLRATNILRNTMKLSYVDLSKVGLSLSLSLSVKCEVCVCECIHIICI
jgi:predicted RNA methylase